MLNVANYFAQRIRYKEKKLKNNVWCLRPLEQNGKTNLKAISGFYICLYKAILVCPVDVTFFANVISFLQKFKQITDLKLENFYKYADTNCVGHFYDVTLSAFL